MTTLTTTASELKEMAQRGAAHFAAGLKLTPHDCAALDAELFATIKRAAVNVEPAMVRHTMQARVYGKLRSAFNTGWVDAYHAV